MIRTSPILHYDLMIECWTDAKGYDWFCADGVFEEYWVETTDRLVICVSDKPVKDAVVFGVHPSGHWLIDHEGYAHSLYTGYICFLRKHFKEKRWVRPAAWPYPFPPVRSDLYFWVEIV